MSGEEDVEVYVYNGVDEVPMDVTHVRVEPSVTVIPERAFKDREELIEVELPKGLVTIGDQAFEGCGSLTSVNIPSTVEEIRLEAFYECRKLSGVTLPEGLQRLGEWSFVSCDSLKSINIPPNLKTISQGTFLYCSSLSEVVSSEGIEVIGKDAFSKCKALESVTFPSSLRVIGNESFEGCIMLNEIHMHDAIEIDEMAFWDCNFTNFRIPPRVSHLNINFLGSNNSLVSLELSEHVTIEDDVNIVLGSLRNIKLPSDYVVDDTSSLPERFTSLVEAFSDDDNNTPILEALQHRFDDLPIHKICYYQSYHDNETNMQHLKREINPYSLAKRLDSLSVSNWREDLEDIISTFPEGANKRDRDTQAVYDKLATYESIKEGTSVLELALWKAKIDESHNKRARIDSEVGSRGQCRINCGADIVMRNLLPYLLPKLVAGEEEES